MRLILCCLLLALPLSLSADEKIDPAKLVGKWEQKDTKSTIEFAKDGVVTITIPLGDKEKKIEGAYTVDGNKVILTAKKGDSKDSVTNIIVKLTDAELVTKDEQGKERAFSRVKDKK